MMITCKNCRWKMPEPYTPEMLAAARKGESLPARRMICTVNPPVPIPIFFAQQTEQGLKPIQIIVSQYPTVTDETPECSKYEYQSSKTGTVKLEAIK
jgi:hypothetical protein